MNVVSLLFAFSLSWFFCSVFLPHESLLPLGILLLLSLIVLFKTAAFARHPFFVILLAAAAAFVLFVEASQTQWQVSINIAMFGSASCFSFQNFISSHFVFFVVVLSPGKTASTCLSFCLPPLPLVCPSFP